MVLCGGSAEGYLSPFANIRGFLQGRSVPFFLYAPEVCLLLRTVKPSFCRHSCGDERQSVVRPLD